MNNTTPLVKEFPVRRPTTLQENAFFFYGQNRDYLRGTSNQVDANIPVPPTTAMNRLAVWGGLGLFASLVVSLANPQALWVAAAIITVFVICLPPINRRKRAYLTERVTREGHFLQGTLLRCAAVGSERYSGLQTEADYEFLSPTGTLLQGTLTQARPDLSGVQLPAPGTPIYVLYFSDKEFYLL